MSERRPSEGMSPEELRFLIQKVARRIRNKRGDDTISDSQLVVVFDLVDGPLSPGELAVRERVTPPSMTRTVNSLERRGLVRRQPHGDDARRVEVVLTPEGERLAAATARLRTEWFSRRLAELSPAERAALEAAAPVLRRLLEGD